MFYKLDYENDRDIVGRFPQVMSLEPSPNILKQGNLFDLSRLNKTLPPLNITKSNIILAEDSILTDFISSSMLVNNGFLISQKVKNIVDGLSVPDHQFIPLKVIHKDKEFNYFWLHIISENNEFIDFFNSSFVKVNSSLQVLERVELSSEQEYEEVCSKLEKRIYLKSNKLVVDTTWTKIGYDLFKFPAALNGHYWSISERFLSALLSNQVTGFSYWKDDVMEW